MTRILVTGATGHVGSELVRQLASIHRVRALVRNSSPARLSFPPEVEPAEGDLSNPDSLHAPLRDVQKVFLLGGFADMAALLAAIRHSGVEHVVLLTSRSVQGGDPANAIVAMWLRAEAAVQDSHVPWTILRPSGFMSNTLEWAPQIRSGDTVRAPFGNVPIAAIDPADIAAVAAHVLSSSGHESRAYELSGPAAILPADRLKTLGELLGRDLRLEAVPDSEAARDLRQSFSPEIVEAFLRFFAMGEFDDSGVAPLVHDLLGRPPRTFRNWAEAHLDHFRSHLSRTVEVSSMSSRDDSLRDETAALRQIFESWAKAVRDEDLLGIRANHDPDILMFDVPPPLQSRGLGAYMATWDTFYRGQSRPVVFDFEDVEITAGHDVAFATAIGHCVYLERMAVPTDLKFRLTVGFRKRGGKWYIVHEHHSVPAND